MKKEYKGYIIQDYKGKSKTIKYYANGDEVNFYGATIEEVKNKIDLYMQ